MATNFPTSLDNTDSQKVVDGTNVIVAALPNNLLDMIEALQAKVGVNGSAVQSSIDFFIRKNYVKVSDVKANAHGGTFPAGAWRTRTLNTEDNDAGGLCSLSSNQITLAAGTYRCHIMVPACSVQGHVARLYNTTAASELIRGTTQFCTETAAEEAQSYSIIVGQFTVAASQALEVQHYCSSNNGVSGVSLGRRCFTSGNNVYAVAEFWKLY